MSCINRTGTLAEQVDSEFSYNLQMDFYILAAEAMLYGAYTILFAFYVHILYTRPGMSKNRFLNYATISLFILSTVHFVLLLATTVTINAGVDIAFAGAVASRQTSIVAAGVADMAVFLYVTSNVIADSIFIFRCYAIWNYQLKAIIFPILCTIAVAGFGYLNAGLSIAAFNNLVRNGIHVAFNSTVSSVFFIAAVSTSLGTTILLMVLSAGRIWWLAHISKEIMGYRTARRYHTILTTARSLESGAVYALGAITSLALFLAGRNPQFSSGFVLEQLVGIAPTIIAVRVGLDLPPTTAEQLQGESFLIKAHTPHPRLGRLPTFRPFPADSMDQPQHGVIYLCAEGNDYMGAIDVLEPVHIRPSHPTNSSYYPI
ncbi:hypothetical protein FB45DRAFT_1053491 [Roridomyces roridus]|uniref:Uncharacterized protein n=1 Tax=Roridomyces roridus TaxID=1738132 RepID=A0AAD7FXS7_9AGAR|nr:hypothetical protein FB45DRAFT_1053491 [Roridomyces roridus]